MTPRQREMLDVIRMHVAANGYPPTLREIGERMGIASTNGVADHLKALERKGYVTRTARVSRGLRLTEKAS